jgi:hypothetical protein
MDSKERPGFDQNKNEKANKYLLRCCKRIKSSDEEEVVKKDAKKMKRYL